MQFSFKVFLYIIILFTYSTSFSQNNLRNEKFDGILSLDDRIRENQKLMSTDLEGAKVNIDLLLEEALSSKNQNAEILILANLCRYYFQKEDAFGLFKASEVLKMP